MAKETLNVRLADPAKRLKDPESGAVLEGSKATKVADTPWMRRRIRTGRVIDLDAEARARVAAEAKEPDLAAELDAANKRIAELEAELKKTKKG